MGLQIKEIIPRAEEILKEAKVAEYKIDAELLLCHVIKYDKRKIFMNWTREIDDKYIEEYFDAILKRADGFPTQYVTHEQDFMGHNFYVDEHVLIPRQDTEVLVETILDYIKAQGKKSLKVLDIGTGSGAIGISIAKSSADIKVTASDVSEGALKVAEKNAARLHVSKQIKFVRSDLFVGFKKKFSKPKFDMIVSNPPYIETSVIPTLQREISDHEPFLALDGGEDGLDFYKEIIPEAPEYLNKKGVLFLEIGYNQADAVSLIIAETDQFTAPAVIKDLAGNDRVIQAVLK